MHICRYVEFYGFGFGRFLYPRSFGKKIDAKSFENFEFKTRVIQTYFSLDNKRIQLEKLPIIKLYNSLISTILVFVISPSEIVWKLEFELICEDLKLNFRTVSDFKKKILNFDVLYIVSWFSHFFIWGHLGNSKKFEIQNIITSKRIWWIRIVSNVKSYQLKNCIPLRDIQNLYKVCLQPASFEQVLNFTLLHIFSETALNPVISSKTFVEAAA